jgi:IMP dehydrogenase
MPLVSAAMDTVTEARMAIAMARQGGLGILHRNLSIEDQAYQVDLVKRTQTGMITNPVTIGPDATLGGPRRALRAATASRGCRSSTPTRHLLGIITNRDLRFTPVAEWATSGPRGHDADAAHHRARGHQPRRGDRPAAPAQARATPADRRPGSAAGLITVKDFVKSEQFPHASKDATGDSWSVRRSATSARPGSGPCTLIEAGVDVLVVDTAHGHARSCSRWWSGSRRTRSPRHVQVVGGNIATRAGAQALVDAGADAVKVGVGPGSICTTRIVAGVGVPQITAIHEARKAARPAGVPVIADGGLQYSGDIAKALVAGADTVMVGSLLAGCEESARGAHLRQRQAVQVLPRHGLAGGDVLARQEVLLQGPLLPGRRLQRRQDRPRGHRGPGRSIAARSAAVTHQLVGGLHQSMFYVGAQTIPDLQERGRFVRITAAGLRESHPHDISGIVEAPNYTVKP